VSGKALIACDIVLTIIAAMQQIGEQKLETDPVRRFLYLAEFISFTSADAVAVQSVAMSFGPMILEFIDKNNQALLSWDATARYCVRWQSCFEGSMPVDLKNLTAAHPQNYASLSGGSSC